MATRTISTRVAIEGESEYRQSVSNINSALGALKAELGAVKAEYRNNANGMDALRAKGEVLNNLHAQQTDKIRAVEGAYENAKRVQQEYAAGVEQAQGRVQEAKRALENLAAAAGSSDKAQADLTAELEKYNKELANAERYNEAAQRGVNGWKKELNNSQRDLTKLNSDISINNQYLDEAKKSADGCAVSIDQYGKTVREAKKETEALATKNKSLADSLSDSAGRLNSAGNALSVGLTAPLVAAGAASVNYASDTAESMNKVEVAFGYAAEGVKKWSETTLTSYGLAKGTALDMAALFGDMATSMGYSQAEAADMSKTLVGLAADMASFKNISIGEASTALKSIFTGETESLKNLGIVMTEVNLKEYALAQGIKTSYTEMGQAEKMSLRYQYVLDATKNSQGDFARTSDGTANQLRVFQESLKEAAAVAGDELLPVITPIIGKLSELTQSFGDLDEGTRKAVVQTGLFLAALGPMLKLTGGVTSAVSAGVAAYTALSAAKAMDTSVTVGQAAATTSATAAQTGLNAAMGANPIGIVITAVGALVAALLAFGAASALTADKTENLNQKVRESRAEYEEARASVARSSADTLSAVSSLESLIAVEHKSAAQKAVVLDMVQQLNKAVPELSLAYDEQNDSINMTTESLRSMAEAMNAQQEREAGVMRMSELLVEQTEAEAELAAAKEVLRQAQENLAESEGKGEKAHIRTSVAVDTAQALVDKYTKILNENQSEAAALDAKYNALTATIEDEAVAMGAAAGEAERAADSLVGLKSVLDNVQGGYELLAKGQKEQADSGSLSIDTVTALIEKYPELTQYLVETADGYVLTEGALQDYIAAQKSAYQVALNEATQAAATLIQQNTGETNAIDQTTEAIKRKLAALKAEADAKINAISVQAPSSGSMYGQAKWAQSQEGYKEAAAEAKAYSDALKQVEAAERDYQSVDRTFSMLGRDTSSSSSKKSGKEKTQAEKDLEAYREAVKALDHDRAMDYVSEKDYYRRKAALGELYLKESLDERRKLDEELYEYKNGAYERDLAALDKALENEEITLQQHQDGLKDLQAKHLTEGSEAWEQNEALQAADRKAAYDDELADLKYFRDMEIVSEAEYYSQLYRLQHEYLEQGSDEWRSVNKELYDYTKQLQKETLDQLKKNLDEQLDAAKDSYDERVQALKDSLSEERDALKDGYSAEKEAAKEAYEAKKDAIKAELDLEKERLNGILDGIDEEIQARKELREDEGQDGAIAAAQKRLDAAKAQLAFANSDEDKQQWADEVIRLEAALKKALQDKEDTEFYREREQEKEGIRDQIEAAEDAADAKLDAAEKSYDALTARLEAQYNASLKKLEADYEARITAAEAEYEAMVDRLNRKYEEAAWKVENGSPATANPGGAGGGTIGGIAKDMAGVLGAVAGKVAQVVSTVQNITNTKSANVTINQASGLTSGQIGAAVKRAIEAMGR